MLKVAINGFGRIGRATLRVIWQDYSDEIEVAAINTSGSMETAGWAHLLKYDTVYGQFDYPVEVMPAERGAEIGRIRVGNKVVPVLAERKPAHIPWDEYEAKAVLECTGVFRDKTAEDHLGDSVEKVILSAPPKAKGIPTYLIGINASEYQGEKLLSNGSCTTNCVAPIVKVMDEEYSFEEAMMMTAHAYTSSQNIVDGSNKDWRRGRAAAQNMVPTGTGAAQSVVEAYPQVKGRFAASALRVPVICGSYSTFIFKLRRTATVDEINQLFERRKQADMAGVIDISYEPLVSSDVIGNPASCLLDAEFTRIVDEDLVYLSAWYDNEWAYSCRLAELALVVSK